VAEGEGEFGGRRRHLLTLNLDGIPDCTACTAASTSTAVRQPYAASSQPESGRKMVEANPATTVTASSAPPRRSASNQETTAANAAS